MSKVLSALMALLVAIPLLLHLPLPPQVTILMVILVAHLMMMIAMVATAAGAGPQIRTGALPMLIAAARTEK